MEENQENEQLKEKIMLPKPIQQKLSSTRILLINDLTYIYMTLKK